MKKEMVWRTNFRVLWSSQFLAIAGLTVMVPLLPFYMEELGAKDPQSVQFWSGLALGAPAITLGLASPLWGKLGDHWSRKWMVIRAIFGLGFSLCLMGLVQTPLQFFRL
jgi:MFS family permease